MGDSLQTYRCRIGTFTCKVSKGSTKNTRIQISNGYRYSLFLVILMSLLLIFFNLRTPCKHSGQASTPRSSFSPPGTALPTSTSSRLVATPKIQESSNTLIDIPCLFDSRDRNFLAKIVNGNRGVRGTGIKLAHWNKGPSYLHNKHDEIETLIADHRPHILGLSEANFRRDHDLAQVQHADYDLHLSPTLSNPSQDTARIVVYTHRSLIVKRRVDLEDKRISAIWLEVGLPHKKKILVCQGYREWKYLGQADQSSGAIGAQLDRWSVFLALWEQALVEGKEVIVMMDANLDFIKWTNSNLPPSDNTAKLKPLIDLLFEKIFPLGVSQVVTVATRSWPGQEDSGLDHIYTNKPDKVSSVQAEFKGGSDHKLIQITRFAKSIQRTVRYVRKRVFKNFDENEFKQAVQQLSWWELYSSNDPEEAAEILTRKITTILDSMAPVKTIQVRKGYAPWLSESTKRLIKERNEAHVLASRTKQQDDFRHYKHLRNQTTAKLRQDKKTWEKLKLDNNKNDPRALWKNVKTRLNWNNSGPPSKLFHDGKIITSPAGIAGTMNSFFLGKVADLRENIPGAAVDPLEKLKESMNHRNCSFSLQAVGPADVLKIIKSLKNSRSTGTDYLDTHVIKLIAQDILAPLTHIVNLSISKSKFPSLWKHAKVVPLLKKNDPLIAKNYRPVSLLPILSKVLERVIFNQLVNYLDTNCLVHPNHHGSRAGHSTATALIQMYDTWVEEVDCGNMVGVIMVDLSAAFDMVDFDLLLQKLEIFGLDEGSLDWMRSYLTGRSQSVFVDGCLSPPLTISCGVPQGSILGPLLYILYTNDIPDLVHKHPISVSQPEPYCQDCGGTVCYVDDSTYCLAGQDPAALSSALTDQYKVISNYMAANKLVINDDKTHLLVLGTKAMKDKSDKVTLQAGMHNILPSRHEKLLGCNVSENLKWRNHVMDNDQSMIRQLSSRINGLAMISSNADFNTRLMVANGIVMSKLCYMIQLWGGCEEYLLNSLQIQLNKTARLVTRLPYYTSSKRLMQMCGWMTVRQLVKYHTILMVHKTTMTKKPVYISNRLSREHPCRTRQESSGCIRLDQSFRSRTDLPRKSFRYRGAHDYNSIPPELRATASMTTFKTKLKKWIKMNVAPD